MKKITLLLLTALFLLNGKVQVAAQIIDSTMLPQVGGMLGSGVVYHVDEAARKLLVVALTDAPDTAKNFYRTWGEQGQLIPEASYGENGKKNTAAIIVAQVIRPEIRPQNNPYPHAGDFRDNSRPADTARRAAHWCTELRAGEEWFLPSREQLRKLYAAKDEVNAALASIRAASQLSDGYYWSSTQFDADNAWYVFFDNGETAASAKSNVGNVRAIKEYTWGTPAADNEEEEESGSYEGVYGEDEGETAAAKKSALNVLVYPTSTTGTLNVEGLEGKVKVYVYNAFGTLLMSQVYEGAGGFILNLSAAPSGTLFVRFNSGGKSVTKQIVKQ
jgi:hypothetical protein